MSASTSRPHRRVGIAGVTAALLTSAALGIGAIAPTAALAGDGVTFSPVETSGEDVTFAEPDAIGVDAVQQDDAAPDDASDANGSPAPADNDGGAPGPIEPSVYPAEAAAPQGCVTVGVRGSLGVTDGEALLVRINEIRAEAAAEGIFVDGQAVAGAPLTWSTGLTYGAQIRAAEAAAFPAPDDDPHARPNGLGPATSTDTTNTLLGLAISSELTADNYADAASCLEGWYREKDAYLAYLATGDTSGTFEHYAALIGDTAAFVGIAAFTLDATGLTTTILELSGASSDSADVRAAGAVMQEVNVALASGSLDASIELPGGIAEAQVIEGTTMQLTARVLAVAPTGDSSGSAATANVDYAPSMQLTWSSSDESIASVDENGLVTGVSAGTATVSVTQNDTVLASLPLTVQAAAPTVASIEQPADVVTPVGVEPVLPETVRVTWSDGNTTDEAVIWGAIDPASYAQAGTSSIVGSLASTGDTVSCTIIAQAAAIVGVEQPAGVQTQAGAAPELPATARATWSDGDVTDEAIAWDAVDPSAYAQAGTFQVAGAVEGWGEPVTCEVAVEAAAIVGVEQPAGVQTQAGAAPELPATARATWSDGDVTDEAIAWDAVDPSAYAQAGTFQVAGAVEGWGEPVTCEVTVSAASIVGVEQPAGVSTQAGTAPVLPATARATWSDGDVTDEQVTWDAVDPALYTARTGGTFDVAGAVAGWSEPVSCTVTVSPAVIAAVESAAATTDAGVAPVLPQTARVTWSNGDVTDEQVTWDAIDPTQYAAQGSFTVAGTVGTDASAVRATCTVSVGGATVVDVATLADVQTYSGVAPALPETVTATWSNGSTTSEKITWDAIAPASYAAAGRFTATGTVASLNRNVSLTVEVRAVGITSLSAVEVATPAGMAPTLPATIQATWENGSITNEAVTWAGIDPSSYAAQGARFEVSGTIAADANARATATVNVGAPVAVSVSTPTPVSTVVGVAPQLPATATVTMSDGSTSAQPVTWNAVDAASYQAKGSFTVSGTAAGLTVNMTVNVNAATVASVQDVAVSTTAGTAPQLPATAAVTWSNGTVTNETVSWRGYDAALYAKAGTFLVTGKVAGANVTATVTVQAAQADASQQPSANEITKSGDATISPVLIGVLCAAGVAAVVGGIALALHLRKKR